MNRTWIKISIIAGFILLISSLLFVIKFQQDAANENKQLQQTIVEMQQLKDGTMRSESKFVSDEDLKSLAANQKIDIKEVEKDLKTFGGEVKAIDVVKVITPGKVATNLPSTKIENSNPQPTDKDSFHYLLNRQVLSLSEPIGKINVPFGNVGFSAWQKNPWDISISPRKYILSTVIGQDEEGRDYTYHKMLIETEDKTFEIPITEARISQTLPKSKLYFNPKLALGIAGGISLTPIPKPEIMPLVEITLASYGKNKFDNEWLFGGIGIGYQSIAKEVALQVTPVRYNLGKQPFVVKFAFAIGGKRYFYKGFNFRLGDRR
jgi:hypothetical protein